jgi:hypothetical protein
MKSSVPAGLRPAHCTSQLGLGRSSESSWKAGKAVRSTGRSSWATHRVEIILALRPYIDLSSSSPTIRRLGSWERLKAFHIFFVLHGQLELNFSEEGSYFEEWEQSFRGSQENPAGHKLMPS